MASVGSNMIPAWKKQVLLGVLRRHEMRVTDLCPAARTGTRSCDLPAAGRGPILCLRMALEELHAFCISDRFGLTVVSISDSPSCLTDGCREDCSPAGADTAFSIENNGVPNRSWGPSFVCRRVASPVMLPKSGLHSFACDFFDFGSCRCVGLLRI